MDPQFETQLLVNLIKDPFDSCMKTIKESIRDLAFKDKVKHYFIDDVAINK